MNGSGLPASCGMVQKKPTGEKKLRDVAGATGGCCVDHSNMCNMCNMYSETKDTVDGGEILHQLVVYPRLSHDFVSFLPSQASMIYRSHHRTCELGQLESLRIALFGGKQPGKTTMRFVGFFRKTREPARDSSAFWFKFFFTKGQVPADRFHPKLGSIPAREYFNRKTLQNPNCSFRRVDFGRQRSKGLECTA